MHSNAQENTGAQIHAFPLASVNEFSRMEKRYSIEDTYASPRPKAFFFNRAHACLSMHIQRVVATYPCQLQGGPDATDTLMSSLIITSSKFTST